MIHATVFKSVNDMRKQIDDYIVFYNTVRPHNKITGKTPDQFEKEYYENLL